MAKKAKQIVIVTRGPLDKRDYQVEAEAIMKVLANVEMLGEPRKAAVVEVVKSEEQAREKAQSRKADIVIFLSPSNYQAGQNLRQEFPKLKVLVLAGVNEQPYIVPPLFLGDEMLKHLVLFSDAI